MPNYFVSYTQADKAWAEWISWQIEAVGHRATVQAWDFRPGTNFVMQMHAAAATADATIAVISSDYLEKAFTAAEWASAFAKDPIGSNRALIPVRVADVHLTGLLAQVIYIDLFDVTDEGVARARLIAGIGEERNKPASAPLFPAGNSASRPAFPAATIPTPPPVVETELEVELRINGRFEDFNAKDQEKLINAIRGLLAAGTNIKVTKVAPGSIVIGLRMPRPAALRLILLYRLGRLRSLNLEELDTPKEDLSMAEIVDELSIDEPPADKSEMGTIVYLSVEGAYGIVERDRGGFLTFHLGEPPLSKAQSVASKAKVGSRTVVPPWPSADDPRHLPEK